MTQVTFRIPSIVFGGSKRPPTAMVVNKAPMTVGKESDVHAVGGFNSDTVSVGINPGHARELASDNVWVARAVNYYCQRIARAERAIVPIDHTRPYDLELQRRLTFLLENPNPRGDSWRTFIEPIVYDFCTVGNAGWEKVVNWKGWPLAMYPFDSRWMHEMPNWDGSEPNRPRYVWRPQGHKEVHLKNSQVVYFYDNPTTFRVGGWSKLAILRKTVEADLSSDNFIRSLLDKYPPPGWLHLGPKSTARQVKAVSEMLRQQVLGQGGMLVTGNMEQPIFHSLWQGTSRENQLREWSEWFGRKVAVSFGISPIELGLTSDVNRSTSQSQESISADNGVIGTLVLIEEMYNREVIASFGGTPEQLNLSLQFKDVTWAERANTAAIIQKLSGGVPTMELNELRQLQDLQPRKGGNAIFAMISTGPIPFLGMDAQGIGGETAEADIEDQEAQSGEEPSEVALPDDSPNSPTESVEETKKFLELYTRIYVKLWFGEFDWKKEVDKDITSSLTDFLMQQYENKLLEFIPRNYSNIAKTSRKIHNLRSKFVFEEPIKLYDYLENVERVMLGA